MPKIQEIINEIELVAPRVYQESYDNAGLITGNKNWECSGALISLDCIEAVVQEAIDKDCNLIVAHHPIVFKGLKSITGKNYVERTIIKAIKNDIAIYACHTNMDNVYNGVNAKIAEKLNLENTAILAPKSGTITQLITYVPHQQVENVRQALFDAGAGKIGNYSHCSFNSKGEGSFMGDENSTPSVGEVGKFHLEGETRLEVLVPIHLQSIVLTALRRAHPYEEVAYYFLPTNNENQEIGSGMIGELPEAMDEEEFLKLVKKEFNSGCVRHTNLLSKKIKKVALCGGAGSFLLPQAIRQKADVYVSADFKYHEFFDADNQIVIADIGHFESEQFTGEIFSSIITKKYRTFAVHFSTIETNPINYL